MRVRDHASPPGASSTRQTRRSRTLVGPVSVFWFVGLTIVGPASRMSACWHRRRKLRPECTGRINNRELGHRDICRREGRSYSSHGPPRPTSATAYACPPTQMIGTVVAVPTWRPRGELPVVYQSDNADRKPGVFLGRIQSPTSIGNNSDIFPCFCCRTAPSAWSEASVSKIYCPSGNGAAMIGAEIRQDIRSSKLSC